MRVSQRSGRASSALVLYVVVLVAFEIFLLTVAVEAFQTDDERLAWARAAISVVVAGGAAVLHRFLRP